MYENLLNPNEFSSISGVSKQTLLFYEKKNVFKPIFKNEKGFRFYSLEQLDIIVTIQALQTIGLSLKEIQNYIENRNADLIYDLYSNRMHPFPLVGVIVPPYTLMPLALAFAISTL